MTGREVRELTEGELTEKARAFREELFKLRLRASVSQLENPMRIRALRRDLARIATVLKERVRGAALTGGGKA